METLARRLEADGALPTRDAVRLIARLARTVEGLHGTGSTHGRLSPLAVLIPGKRLASARLVRSVAAKALPLMRAPERGPDDAPSSADDTWAVALLLYLALTGQRVESSTTVRRPLAVFDVGDDALQQLIDSALHKNPASRPRSLVAFREALDAWLADEGADVDDALPWDDENKTRVKTLDLSSLPPPPRAEPSRRGEPPKRKPPPLPKLHAKLDEESTLPEDEETADGSRATVAIDEDSRATTMALDDESRATIPANVEDVALAVAKRKALAQAAQPGPRLVPPKIVAEKKRRRAAAAGDTIRLDDGEAPPFRSPESSPSEAPASRPTGRSWTLPALALVAALGGGAYLLSRDSAPAVEPTVDSSDAPRARPTEDIATGIAEPLRPAPTPTSEASASVIESAEASASAPASAASSSSASAEPPSREESCVRAGLPPDTFESGWVDLSFVCGEADVVKGARRLREAIVLGGSGRGVTNGMKEWSLLGFFELPTYAVVRDRCCPKAGPPSVPASPAICTPTMDDAVFGVMQAARRGEVPAEELAKVDKAARCILRAKQATSFGQHPKPSGGEGTALRTIASRINKFLKTR